MPTSTLPVCPNPECDGGEVLDRDNGVTTDWLLCPDCQASGKAVWLAGLLEGEGYFGATRSRRRRLTLRVSLNMTDRDIVERAVRIVGSDVKIGSTHGRASRPSRWTPTYSAQWSGADAERIMRSVLPYMGERRSAVIRAALSEDCSHRRPPYCRNGHPRIPENQIKRSDCDGYRCRVCQREAGARKRARRKAAA